MLLLEADQMMHEGLDEDDLQELEDFERHADAIVKFGAGAGHKTVIDNSLLGWQSFESSKGFQEVAKKFHTVSNTSEATRDQILQK